MLINKIKGIFLLLLFFCFLTGCGKFFNEGNSSEFNIIVKLIQNRPKNMV